MSPPEEDQPLPAEAAPPPRVFGARRALLIFGAFWVLQLVVVFFVMVFAAIIAIAKGTAVGGVAARLMEGPILLGATLAGTATATLLLLFMLRGALRGVAGVSPETPLALIGWAPASARASVRAAGQAVLILVAFVLVSRFLPDPSHPLGPLARAALAGGWSRVAWAALAVLIAPPSEELVFRGVLYTGLARSWPPVVAAVVTTLAFTAFHATEIRGYWPAWIQIGLMGALTLRTRVRSGSLVPGIVLHATYNFGLVLLTYAASRR